MAMFVAAIAGVLPGLASDRGVFQEPAAFLDEAFAGDVPAISRLWIRREMFADVRRIMGGRLPALRVRYWARDDRIAFVMDQVGKEKPITIGVVLRGGAIERLRILAFRESRGGEVRRPAFTDQFAGLQLTPDLALDHRVDGISGATMSVSAVQRVARLALYLRPHCRPPATIAEN
jgi:hypothetical protein